MECTLCLTVLLESFVHLSYSLRCFACKWLVKLDVPPPSASCWVQRRHCTRFMSLLLTFVTVGGSKNGTCTLSIRYGSLLAFSSTACTRDCCFSHVPHAQRPCSQIRKWRLKKPCDQVFKSGYILNSRITG